MCEEAYRMGDYGGAISFCTQSLEAFPTYAAYSDRAQARTMAGDYEGALSDDLSAERLNGSNPEGQLGLCTDFLCLERPEEALPHCDKSIFLNPATKNPLVYTTRSKVRYLLGDLVGAEADWAKAQMIDLGIPPYSIGKMSFNKSCGSG